MISSEVQRTLVKSPPELWAELSDADALARHLGELGDLEEIRITRTEPESKIEWRAGSTSGAVVLKPSGWGTKVTLSVTRELPLASPDTPSEELPRHDPDSPTPTELDSAPLEPVAALDPTQAHLDPAPGLEPTPEFDLDPSAELEPEAPLAPAFDPDAELEPDAEFEPEVELEPELEPEAELAPTALEPAHHAPELPLEARRGFFARLFRRRAREPVVEAQASLDTAAYDEPFDRDTAAEPQDDERSWNDLFPSAAPEPDPAPAEPSVPAPAEPSAWTPPAPDQSPDEPAAFEPELTPLAVPGADAAEVPAQDAAAGPDIAQELRAAEEVAVEEVTAVLKATLDRLGAAHHRPFSRS